MKNSALLLAIALVALVPPATAEKWRVQPGTVERVADPSNPYPNFISGDFTLKEDATGYEGKNRGGACLVASSPGWKSGPCESHADCTTRFPRPDPARIKSGGLLFDDGYGYCDRQTITIPPGKQVEVGMCWYRPGSQKAYCDVGKVMTEDVRNPVPLQRTDAYPRGVRPISWRVLTCQSLEEGGCGSPGGKKEYSFGPVAEFP